MSHFNTKVQKTVNLAGGRAFKMDSKRELIHAVLTTFLENKFYESGSERVERIKYLVKSVPPIFAANLSVIARKEFYLRSVSHLLIAEVSKLKLKGFHEHVSESIERPDDLMEIASILGGKLPKQIKRGFRHAIFKFSPYQLAKYRGEGKKIKLVDIFNLVHPKAQFASEEQHKSWRDLMEGNLKSTDTWESRLSSGEDKGAVWRDLILNKKIGYMALLRNLRNIEKQADEETKIVAAAMIKDKKLILSSKQLPFRFYNAYAKVTDMRFLNAVARALDISVSNVPELGGETLIAIDVSGSMEGDAIRKASILAAALIKKSNCDVLLYDDHIRRESFNSIDSAISNAEKIQRLATGGGTDTALVFKNAGNKYERIIILSDKESWRSSVQHAYDQYRKENDCFVYAIDIQGYGTKDVKGEKVEHLCGFSERIFDFISTREKGIEGIIEYVENYRSVLPRMFKAADNLIEHKEKNMRSAVEKFKEFMLPEPEKTFRKHGITTSDGMLSEEGKELFINFLFRSTLGNQFMDEVVAKMDLNETKRSRFEEQARTGQVRSSTANRGGKRKS